MPCVLTIRGQNEHMKWAVVDSTREVWHNEGGGKNPKSVGWNGGLKTVLGSWE